MVDVETGVEDSELDDIVVELSSATAELDSELELDCTLELELSADDDALELLSSALELLSAALELLSAEELLEAELDAATLLLLDSDADDALLEAISLD